MAYSYEEAVNYIFELPKFTTKHSFEEGRQFLRMIGDPDRDLRIIHVAGTNGKGSVCAYMESILMHAGFSVGCFISPHLNDVRERIRLGGKMCSEEEFTDAFNRIFEITQKLYVPTFFEYLFFMALIIFKEHKPDAVILETGLGGRLDATNLVSDKLVSILTSIGYDHCEYLGDTLDMIAGEKAGICAKNRPVIFWEDTPGASEISRIAKERGSVEIALQKQRILDIHRDNSNIDFCLEYKYDRFICLKLRGRALYQVENAALAVCSLGFLPQINERITPDDIIEGVYEMFWPGRMEEICPGVIIDGAHNEPAISAFIDSVKEDGASKRLLIFGCMRDKAYDKEIELLAKSGLFEKVFAVHTGYERAQEASVIADGFKSHGMSDVTAFDDTKEALDISRKLAELEGYTAYACGSLYLAGEIRGTLL